MRPRAGLIRDLLEGSFPELYPPPELEPEPEEVEPAEPEAEAEAEASDDAPEPEPPADPEPEPEEGAGEAPPEDDAERPSTPELDAYQKRMAEIDAKVRARRPEPRTEPSVKPNVPKKGALFFFLSERGEPTAVFAISPRSAGLLTVSTPRRPLDPVRVTLKKQNHLSGCFAAGAPERGGDAPRRR